MAKAISKEIRAEAERRLAKGETLSEVSRAVGLATETVYNWASALAKRTVISTEVQQKILTALVQGQLPGAIAMDLQIPKRLVDDLDKTSRGKPIRVLHTEETKQKALGMIASGMNFVEVAKAFNTSRATVGQWHAVAFATGSAKPYKRKSNYTDLDFKWVSRDYPQLDDWREPMAKWMAGEKNALGAKSKMLSSFIRNYLAALQLPCTRAELLKRGQVLPDFYKVACKESSGGIVTNNHLHDFLDWVLLHYFSDQDEDGPPMVSPAYCNPVPNLSTSGLPRPDESVRLVLPYGMICIFRENLAQGPNFKDWTLAQSLMGKTNIDGRNDGRDWFEVTEDQIDKSDPDCVWRPRKSFEGKEFFEMWSPVRWVVLQLKLQLTARTGQVRMADSGESDTWRYINGQFIPNAGPLAYLNRGKPWAQGIFRRVDGTTGPTSILYFNNNKTNDTYKDVKDKGQVCAWPHLEGYQNDPYHWLEKMRNWQEKYNPIKGRTPWSSLPVRRGIGGLKSKIQKAGYPDACFLFRTPESSGEEHLAVSIGMVDNAWQFLMAAFESLLADKGITHDDGSAVRLIDPESPSGRTFYPLHGNRVSLITAFVVDGGMDPVLVSKIVGHSRLLMTVYYTKPGYSQVQNAIIGATEKLDAKKDASIVQWLLSAKAEHMLNNVVFNADNWQTVVEENPTLRNAAGWYLRHDGICFAGGNTSGDVGVRGCHNGGALLGTGKSGRKDGYGPVPGGIMNCSLCRWNAAEKSHGPALAATLNNQFYHLRVAQEEGVKQSAIVLALKKQKAGDESKGVTFTEMRDLKTAERVYEKSVEKLAVIARSIAGNRKMIDRLKQLPDPVGQGMVLAATGDQMTMNAVMEETDSELLQLCGVCGDVEVHPELEPGSAIYRRSQLFDAALKNHSLPPAFALMSEEDQLTFGNAFMRKLADQADPKNPILGLRTVVSIIDHGENLESILGIKLAKLLDIANGKRAKVIPIRLKLENDNGKDQHTS